MPWYCYAMGFLEIDTLQMLAFYNAIANKDSIASPSSIADIRGDVGRCGLERSS